MMKNLAAARAEELVSKLKVRRCTRRHVVAPLIARVGANHFDVFVTKSERSEERRLMEAALRDELRIVLLRRGLPARGLKEDLIKRPLRERGRRC